jgi:hypothetical protein
MAVCGISGAGEYLQKLPGFILVALFQASHTERIKTTMSIDYDAPRQAAEEELTEPLDELTTEKAGKSKAALDLDELDLADSFELPGADLPNEELLVEIVPIQTNEFTCMSCFLVHHRSQIAREKDGKKYCIECES